MKWNYHKYIWYVDASTWVLVCVVACIYPSSNSFYLSAYILLEIAFIHPHSHRNYILTNVWEPLSDDDDSTSHDYYYYGLPFLHTQTHTCARTLRFESIKSQPNCQSHLKLIIDFCISDVYRYSYDNDRYGRDYTKLWRFCEIDAGWLCRAVCRINVRLQVYYIDLSDKYEWMVAWICIDSV